MRLLSAIFFAPKSAAAVDAVDAFDVVDDGKDVRIKLPKRRNDVEDWVPPVPRHAPAREQAQALVAMFQADGRFGPVPHWDFEAFYYECAWMNGYIQITKLQLARALGTICTKVRLDVLDEDGCVIRAAHYVIPEPFVAAQARPDKAKSSSAGNVVSIGTKGAKRVRLSANAGARAKAVALKSGNRGQRRKGAYRADIAEAVACQG